MLRSRETIEMNDGGFGLLPIKSSYTDRKTNMKDGEVIRPSTPPKELNKEVIIIIFFSLHKLITNTFPIRTFPGLHGLYGAKNESTVLG